MNNKEKQIREEFKKLIILGCHPGKSHEEALEEEEIIGAKIKIYKKKRTGNAPSKDTIEKDGYITGSSDGINWYSEGRSSIKEDHEFANKFKIIGLPITIGRVMQAFGERMNNIFGIDAKGEILYWLISEGAWKATGVFWKLTKENYQECTDDDQDIETITKLLNLLKK